MIRRLGTTLVGLFVCSSVCLFICLSVCFFLSFLLRAAWHKNIIRPRIFFPPWIPRLRYRSNIQVAEDLIDIKKLLQKIHEKHKKSAFIIIIIILIFMFLSQFFLCFSVTIFIFILKNCLFYIIAVFSFFLIRFLVSFFQLISAGIEAHYTAI